MSSTDENTPKTDTTPSAGTVRRPAQPAPVPDEPKPAGRKALEQALSESGKELKDLI
ncbi:hypothetical protein [Nonomuraea zeae]|uniref:hypothetical protein n=1 Tax=Nonomuraea zeae TaxID=1642303 RepID=UPI0014788FDC|nr:hypothetical protein [Nonomuraea zeae]